ncbi:hypothetical protein PAA8504_03827 [Palleronia abyssalis]|uniref:Uncharacterized protein n=1 Tax=Palleronia abyssalis TaxID=1501240 RepID=A0A2R8C0M2_9RHOB|nr:hypothetical protein PAA8504_03827 [Palleronia abyssalis]
MALTIASRIIASDPTLSPISPRASVAASCGITRYVFSPSIIVGFGECMTRSTELAGTSGATTLV